MMLFYPLAFDNKAKKIVGGNREYASFDIGYSYKLVYRKMPFGVINHFECEKKLILLKGFIYGQDGKQVNINKLCDFDRFIYDVDGIFSVIEFSGNRVRLISDLSGIYQFYYAYTPQGYVISDRIGYIKKLLSPYPEEMEVLIYLVSARTSPGKTIYKNVFRTIPAHIINLDLNSKSEISHFYINNEALSKIEASLDALSDKAVNIMINGYRYLKENKSIDVALCDLSGGLDSRVTTLLADRVFDKIYVRTTGFTMEKKVSEIVLQKCLSDAAERFIYKDRWWHKDILEDICDEFPGEQDCLTVSKVFQLNTYERKFFKLKIGGSGGEFIKDEWKKDANINFIKYYFTGKLSSHQESLFKKWYLNFYINNRVIEKRSYGLEDMITIYLSSNPALANIVHFNISHFIDFVHLVLTSQPSVSSWQKIAELSSLLLWHPFLSHAFLLMAYKTPFKYRKFNKFHEAIFQKVNPICLNVKTEKKLFSFFTPFYPKVDNRVKLAETLYLLERVAYTSFKTYMGDFLKKYNWFNKSPGLTLKSNLNDVKIALKKLPEIGSYLDKLKIGDSIRDNGLIENLFLAFNHLL